jgi:hypothetical protein
MHISRVDQVRPHFTIWSVGSNRCWATRSLHLISAFLDVEGAFYNTSFEDIGEACADHVVHFTI